MEYWETSAKKGQGIEGLFEGMAKQLYDKFRKRPQKSNMVIGKKIKINQQQEINVGGRFSRCC